MAIVIKTAYEIIQATEPTFLDGIRKYEKNQLKSIKIEEVVEEVVEE